VRRAYIPKAGSATETQPLGIPTFDDKVLQRAVVMVLEAIYEQDFKDCSYGFRPGRSAHQALASLRQQTMAMGGGWIVDVDIRKFFDTIDHGHLRDFLKRRIRQSLQPGAEVNIPMVPVQPASSCGGSAPNTVPEAERSLCLLRNHRQLRCSVPIPLVCDRYLEEMALAASPSRDHSLGPILPRAGAVSASTTGCDPLSVPPRSELMT